MQELNQITEESIISSNDDGDSKNITKTSHGVVNKLIQNGVLTNDQLQIAIEEIKFNKLSSHLTILEVLDKMGFVSEKTMMDIVNPDNKIKQINLTDRILNQDIVKKIPRQFAVHNKVVAIDEDEESVTVAMDNISNIIIIDKIKKYFDYKKVKVLQTNEAQINQVIDKYYQYSLKMSDIVAEIESFETLNKTFEESAGYQDPVVRLVDAIILDALHNDASDIHMEPEEYFVRVRCRIDGVLIVRFSFHKKYWHRVIGRLKIMAGLNIAESRKSQDGGMSMVINDRKVDFRVSLLPGVNGENTVMRILDCSKSIVSLSTLGFSDHNSKLIDLALQKPEGIIILTGPTGSGKTTTLYSIINEINTIDKNIMTLEDPVEYSLPLIRQTNINNKAGLDFAAGLRAILRQDPDVVMIGEIRDLETASIAVKAALTGHQVFSTLHTNDSISGISRLIDIGIQPFLISSALSAIIAQRLTRKLCKSCKKAYHTNTKITNILNKILKKDEKHYTLFKEVGCSLCHHSGFKGRTGVTEVFYINKFIGGEISKNISYTELYNLSKDKGFIPMQEDGLVKVLAGETSLDELKKNINMNEYLT